MDLQRGRLVPFGSELIPRAPTPCLGLSPVLGGGRRKVHEDLKGQNQGNLAFECPQAQWASLQG